MKNITRLLNVVDVTDAPERFLLLKAGWTQALWRSGETMFFFVDRDAFDAIDAAAKRRGIDILVDYEHQSEPTHRRADGKAPAAGWITRLEWVEGEGIYAVVKWTKEAAAEIAEKKYRYFSPVMEIDLNSGRPCVLHSCALTNMPATVGCLPIAASATGARNMDKIFKLLGLTEAASPEELESAIKALIAKAEKSPEPKPSEDDTAKMVATWIGASGVTTKSELVEFVTKPADRQQTIDPAKFVPVEEHTKVLTRLAALEGDKQKAEIDNLIKSALDAGKPVKPIEASIRALYTANPDEARKLIDGLQPVVVMGQITGNGGTDAGSRQSVIAKALSEYESDQGAKKITSKFAFVSQALSDANLDALTKEEREKHGINLPV